MADNSLTLSGNLTRDPELRFTAGGMAVASFGVAVNRKWQNKKTNEWEEKVSFVDCVAWGTIGENCAESLKKGDRVTFHGRLDMNQWETDSGDKRSKLECVIEDIGPSLRWANVSSIVKNPRAEGGHRNEPPTREPDFDPGPAGGYGNDEEPF